MDVCSGKGILAIRIDVDCAAVLPPCAWLKAISSAFGDDVPLDRNWTQITSVSVTTAVPEELTPSCT